MKSCACLSAFLLFLLVQSKFVFLQFKTDFGFKELFRGRGKCSCSLVEQALRWAWRGACKRGGGGGGGGGHKIMSASFIVLIFSDRFYLLAKNCMTADSDRFPHDRYKSKEK